MKSPIHVKGKCLLIPFSCMLHLIVRSNCISCHDIVMPSKIIFIHNLTAHNYQNALGFESRECIH